VIHTPLDTLLGSPMYQLLKRLFIGLLFDQEFVRFQRSSVRKSNPSNFDEAIENSVQKRVSQIHKHIEVRRFHSGIEVCLRHFVHDKNNLQQQFKSRVQNNNNNNKQVLIQIVLVRSGLLRGASERAKQAKRRQGS
jgi:hypothetical protein